MRIGAKRVTMKNTVITNLKEIFEASSQFVAPLLMHVKTEGKNAMLINMAFTIVFGVISGLVGGYVATALKAEVNEANIKNIKESVQRLERQMDRVIDRQMRDGREGFFNRGPFGLDGTTPAAFSKPLHRFDASRVG